MMARLAQRMLQWLVLRHPDQEPLYGDLLEELDRGRSIRWFWSQVAYATASSASREAWRSKRSTAERWALNLAMTGVLLFASYVTWTLGVLVLTLALSRH